MSLHLDNIYYHQDGTTIGNNAFDQILEDILSKDEAIIDGHYFRTIEQRIKWSDLCFLFDLSKEEVLQGLKERLGSDSENCPFIRKEEDIGELMQAWERFDQTNRNIILNYLKNSPKTRLVIFKSRKEVDEYISNLKR